MKPRALSWAAVALSATCVSFATLAAEVYAPGSAEDPRIRSSRFLGEDQRYYSAVTELLKLQPRTGEFEASPDYWAALAEYQLSFGMRDRAETIYRTVAAAAPDGEAASLARLRMAEFEYERGYLDEARASLLRAQARLPKDQETHWKDLYARVLMAQGRYNEAVTALADVDGDSDDDAYLRYNLGVALINDGQLAKGRSALDLVGRHAGKSDRIRALRDKANVTLGWHFLQNQLGGSAKPVLARVRTVGPYSNRALLGVGWAEVAPEGKRQFRGEVSEEERLRQVSDPLSSLSSLGALLRHGYLEDPYDRAGMRSFRRAKLAKNEEAGLRRALVVWVELLDRDPQDPAVQEAWLAVPFALDRLGAHTQAVQYYEQAAERLEAARKRTLDAIQAIKGGRMVETMMRSDADAESGWMWELRDLPDAPETYYLQTLVADHRYAEPLKNYRDVRLLARQLDAWKASIDKMDLAFLGSSRPAVEPAVQFARAKRRWKPGHEKMSLRLREATQLSAPGLYSGRILPGGTATTALRLSEVPTHFDGPYERLLSLKKRTESMRPLLSSVARESARRLRKLGLDELNAQKAQIEKYLVETRFALARLYDGGLPEEDQDEVEVDAKGRPVKLPKLPRGEFEIDKARPLDQQVTRPRPPKATRRGADEEFEVK